MKRIIRISIFAASIIAAVAATASLALAQGGGLRSLRGETPLTDTGVAPAARKQNTSTGRFNRAYRQQPPLIPHNIEKYQINLKVNQCMRCHDWPFNVEEGAPKISETHYVDRSGIALDQVARTRWFCNQCHVPQVNARPLVDNDFESTVKLY